MSDSKPLAQAGDAGMQPPQGTSFQGTIPWTEAASTQQAGGAYGQNAPAYGTSAYGPIGNTAGSPVGGPAGYGPVGFSAGGPFGNPGGYGPQAFPGCPSPAHFMFHQQYGPYAPHLPFGPMPSFGPATPPNAPTTQQAGYQWQGNAQNSGQGVAQNAEQTQAPGHGPYGPPPYGAAPENPYTRQVPGAFAGAPGFGNTFAGGACFGPAGFGPAGPENFGPNAGGAAPNPFGDQAQANPEYEQSQDYFMGMCADLMEGKTDPSKFFGLLSGTGNLFWKGAIVGALLTFALNNDSVKSALSESLSAIFGAVHSKPDTQK